MISLDVIRERINKSSMEYIRTGDSGRAVMAIFGILLVIVDHLIRQGYTGRE